MTVTMKDHFGVFREEKQMREGLERLLALKERCATIGLRNAGGVFNLDLIRTLELEGMVDLALAVATGAVARTESRGSHARTDYPARDDETWLQAHHGALHAGRAAARLQARDAGDLRATGAQVLMPEAKFHIKRYDPARDDKGASRYDDFVVPYDSSLTVLEGLFSIQEHQDGSLAFRYCCRASICGSCAMYINGKYRLACQTNLRHVHADVITVEPMPHLPLVKDLVCDMSDFFAKYEYVKPWLIRNSAPPGARDPAVAGGTPEARHAHRLHPLRRLLQQLPVGVDRGQLPGPGGAAQGLPLRGRLARRGRQGAHALLGQRARRLPLPHDHQLRRGLPQGAQPHRGHPVAQDGGRAPPAVRPQQVGPA